jgi:hypothetical protein
MMTFFTDMREEYPQLKDEKLVDVCSVTDVTENLNELK